MVNVGIKGRVMRYMNRHTIAPANQPVADYSCYSQCDFRLIYFSFRLRFHYFTARARSDGSIVFSNVAEFLRETVR